MKILIFALPRTASKFVAVNMMRYLNDASYKHVELFGGPLKYDRLDCHDGNIVSTSQPIEFESEDFFRNRIDVIRKVNGSLVAKCHQETIYMFPELMSELISLFDHVVVIERGDVFNQLLSHVLSSLSNCFHPGQAIEKYKASLIAEPVTVNLDWWISMIERYKAYRNIEFGVELLRVKVEDLFKASDKEFCEKLKLPIRRFLPYRNSKEFGDKASLVRNYKELKEIFDRMMSE